MGRPLQFKTTKEMQDRIDLYFMDCKRNRAAEALGTEYPDGVITDDLHPTITGLALALDLTRKSLISYEGREEFVNTVKKGKSRVEAYVEQRLFYNNAVGSIFNLKNNFDWKDKTETTLDGGITIVNRNRLSGD